MCNGAKEYGSDRSRKIASLEARMRRSSVQVDSYYHQHYASAFGYPDGQPHGLSWLRLPDYAGCPEHVGVRDQPLWADRLAASRERRPS